MTENLQTSGGEEFDSVLKFVNRVMEFHRYLIDATTMRIVRESVASMNLTKIPTDELQSGWITAFNLLVACILRRDFESTFVAKTVEAFRFRTLIRDRISDELLRRNVPAGCDWQDGHCLGFALGRLNVERIRSEFPNRGSLRIIKPFGTGDDYYTVVVELVDFADAPGEKTYEFAVHQRNALFGTIVVSTSNLEGYDDEDTPEESRTAGIVRGRINRIDDDVNNDDCEKMNAIATHFLWYVL